VADGNKFLTKTFVGNQGQVLLYQPLYGNRGSLAGVLKITSGTAPRLNTITGTPTWFKPEIAANSKDNAYRSGFDPIPLNAVGGAYEPPAPGGIVMGLPTTADNANLEFTDGWLAAFSGEFTQPLTITNPNPTKTANKALIPTSDYAVTMPILDSASGSFSGTYTPVWFPRTAYQGLIIPSGMGWQGIGYFMSVYDNDGESGRVMLLDAAAP
jgi:hypothetical protein